MGYKPTEVTESQPISAVNTFLPMLHEVVGPCLSTRGERWEQRREGPWKGALCWFRRAPGFSLSEVVVLGRQPALQTLSLAKTKLPSGVNCSVSCTEPGWVELVRLGLRWDTPQRAAKINHWCFGEIPWVWSLHFEDHSHGRVAEWPHTEQHSRRHKYL